MIAPSSRTVARTAYIAIDTDVGRVAEYATGSTEFEGMPSSLAVAVPLTVEVVVFICA